MSIFKKAGETEKLPEFIDNAFFDNSKKVNVDDEFSNLLKEASSNKYIYENRVKGFKEASATRPDFTPPKPTMYSDTSDGIRRSSYGQKFHDEPTELSNNKIRSIQYDGTRQAEVHLQNGLSIWEPEFDDIKNAFEKSQEQSNAIFDRKTFVEKRAAKNQQWESEQINSIRKANVLPYRGLGIARLSNEVQVDHNKLNNVGDFYAEANDAIREMTRAANRDRKAKLSRNGYDPEEKQPETKEEVYARTMKALSNDSKFLLDFAEKMDITLHE